MQVTNHLNHLREIHADFVKVLDGGYAVVVPSAALIDGITQMVILILPVSAESLHLLDGALSFRIEAYLFLQLLVVPLSP